VRRKRKRRSKTREYNMPSPVEETIADLSKANEETDEDV
jgi:hypothetical protein